METVDFDKISETYGEDHFVEDYIPEQNNPLQEIVNERYFSFLSKRIRKYGSVQGTSL